MTAPRVVRFPPALRAGDTVAVVAPASPFPHAVTWRGLGFLRERYELRFDRGLFARRGYLAGDDARRRDELAGALADPRVRAIVAVRGGYGASRFVHALDWSAFARAPKWIVGFSDITALHVEASRVGVASIHGPHVTSVGRSHASCRADLVRALEAPDAPREWYGLEAWRAGDVEGELFGGNLTLLHATAAAGRLAVPEGAVLVLEDVTERPYRVDRMLTTLAVGGHLARAGAIVLGDFTQCDPGPDGVTIEEVLRERLLALGVPVAARLPVGHEVRNDALILGAVARLVVGERGATLATRAQDW